jgi:hypothetical protein
MPPMSAEAVDRSTSSEPHRDWPTQAADAVVDVVDKVKVQTTAKAVVAARAIVFGVVIGTLALVAAITLVVGLTRGFQNLLPVIADLFGYDMPHAQAVYLSYFIVGAIFTVVGFVFWRKANRRAVLAQLAEEAT